MVIVPAFKCDLNELVYFKIFFILFVYHLLSLRKRP
jgi:hypothetical protein